MLGRVTSKSPSTAKILANHGITPSSDLNEAQIRQSFVLPLIEELHWDLEDPFEVHPEERSNGGFIDILLRATYGPSFVWEIKRPSVNLDLATESGREAAFQAVGYARTFTQAPFCVVTNFDTTHIFHSYALPPKEKIGKNLIASFSWLEAREGSADEILALLEKPSVIAGVTKDRFDSLVADKHLLRAKRPLHESILEDLEYCRITLAKAFRAWLKSNPILEIDGAVEILVNRLLFIRCCEDRQLEEKAHLRELVHSKDLWPSLVGRIFPYYHHAYNSDLFAEHPIIDAKKVQVDDSIMLSVINRTFFTGGEAHGEVYDFSIIPLEILGSAYESYLAKELVESGKDIYPELKPEVKKAGGVCYTPTFIVDSIVRNTIGAYDRERGCEAPLPKVLDPACGSGTFLIKALEQLIDLRTPRPTKKSEMRVPLPLQKRRKILEECIFGVDLDPRAVEITKLSLLLKLLEPDRSLPHGKSSILPSLTRNLRVGNSLISPRNLIKYAPKSDFYRMSPLDWNRFMRDSGVSTGFDIVIGNPPYVRIQVLQEYYPEEADVYSKVYESASSGNVDIYVPFIEHSIQLLAKDGFLGFICPHRFWTNDYGKKLRKEIAAKKILSRVINFRAEQVFEGVATYTCILILQNKPRANFEYLEAVAGTACEKMTHMQPERFKEVTSDVLPSTILMESPWLLAPQLVRNTISEMEKAPRKLRDFVAGENIFQGLITGRDPVFLLERRDNGHFYSEELDEEIELEKDLLVPTLKGSLDLRRLRVPESRAVMLFPYLDDGSGNAKLISFEELREKFPRTAKYLQSVEAALRSRKALKTKAEREEDVKRDKAKFKDGWFYDADDFFKYSRNQALNCVYKRKLIVPALFRAPTFFWDDEGTYSLTGSGSGGGGAYAMFLKPEFERFAHAIVGILSSGLLLSWFMRRGDVFRDYYVGVDEKVLLSVPLPDLAESSVLPLLEELDLLVNKLLANGSSKDRRSSTRIELENAMETIVEELYFPGMKSKLAA